MRYHLNISEAVGGAAPVNPGPRPPAGGRFSFGGLAVAPRAPFLVFFIVWPAPALLFAQFFARFSSTFGVFSSTFGVFLSTYSLVFACISRIFFVSLQYSYKVSGMFNSDLYQDDFLDAMFSDAEMKCLGSVPLPHSAGVSSVPSEACSPAGAGVLNPCVRCPLAGVCSPDDCAQHDFPLDLPFPPTRFRNLGEYINLLKHYGWA